VSAGEPTERDRVIGHGWATVELERAADDHRASLLAGTGFESAPRSAALGARCLRGRSADGTGWIVLLEPDTEGRISAFLARHGEGWAATWLAADRDPSMTAGPLGAEAIDAQATTPRWGPYRLRSAAATIER